MILHSIEFSHVGRFRGTWRIGPLAKGVNLLGAPNESGKTTTVRALARGLFDRHTTKGDEIKSLQPAGTDLAPRVVVEFETAAGRFRASKTFLLGPRSELHRWISGRWEPEAEGDAADQRIQGLLRSGLPGRGATRPEHWGLLGFLWAQQGAPAAWPDLAEGPVAPQVRARLAQVEIDPLVEVLRNRLADEWQGLITQAGRPRVGGALAAAEAEREQLVGELDAVRRLQSDQEEARGRHQRSTAEVARLRREAEERTPAAAALRGELRALEKARAEIRLQEQALAHRRERLQALLAEEDRHRELRREIAGMEPGLAAESERHRLAAQEREELLARIEALVPERSAALDALERCRRDLRAVQEARQGLRLAAEAVSLAERAAQVRELAAQRVALEEERNGLAPVTSAQLRLLEEAEEAVRGLDAQVRALGLHVEITPEAEARVSFDDAPAETLAPGEVRRWTRPQQADVRIPGWGRIRIRSGSQESLAAVHRLAEARTRRMDLLREIGTSSLEDARGLFQRRRELELRIEAAGKELRPQLAGFRTPEELSEAATRARQRSEAHRAAAADPGGPDAPSPASPLPGSAAALEEMESSLAAAIPEAERRCRELGSRMETLAAAERKAGRDAQAAAAAQAETAARIRAAEGEAASIAQRHAGGLEAALAAAKLAAAEAEGRLMAAQAGLPPDAERLPERVRRAEAALVQLEEELTLRRAERDEAAGRLEALGGQGLYSRETAAEERLGEVEARLASVRTRAMAARLLNSLLDRRKDDAIRAVLAPLEERLSRAFAEITGDETRRIFLDGNLSVVGVGRSRAEAHAFDLLSQGGREQLLLCLRLAVAEELAAEEPQVLVLDDALVNTDPGRLERIHGLLESRADRIQVLLLTCHPDRYRGLGRPLAWSGPLGTAA